MKKWENVNQPLLGYFICGPAFLLALTASFVGGGRASDPQLTLITTCITALSIFSVGYAIWENGGWIRKMLGGLVMAPGIALFVMAMLAFHGFRI
jgi:hypothetical protein